MVEKINRKRGKISWVKKEEERIDFDFFSLPEEVLYQLLEELAENCDILITGSGKFSFTYRYGDGKHMAKQIASARTLVEIVEEEVLEIGKDEKWGQKESLKRLLRAINSAAIVVEKRIGELK